MAETLENILYVLVVDKLLGSKIGKWKQRAKELKDATIVYAVIVAGMKAIDIVTNGTRSLRRELQDRLNVKLRLRRKLEKTLRKERVINRTWHKKHLVATYCTICRKRTIDAVNMPCRHAFVCWDCNRAFQERHGASSASSASAICNACRAPCSTQHIVHPLRFSPLGLLTRPVRALARKILRVPANRVPDPASHPRPDYVREPIQVRKG
eukprot:2424016-Pyramimonas_sp.AAC.1